jgi:ATPase subunit of ABC transporter with duplicated ATPase domains
MNAFEMADNLCVWAEDIYGGNIFFNNVANMLRQQADRIAELELTEKSAPTQSNELSKVQSTLAKYAKRVMEADKRIAELEKQLAFMEGEYPEPTIVEKMTEFESLEQACKRIAELEKQLKHWTTPCQPLCKPSVCDCITPQTKPLSDEERVDFTVRIYNCRTGAEAREIVLAIEAKVRGEK